MLKSIAIPACPLSNHRNLPQARVRSIKGVVARRISGCDYFMVDATGGYAVLEWYGGHDPDSGGFANRQLRNVRYARHFRWRQMGPSLFGRKITARRAPALLRFS